MKRTNTAQWIEKYNRWQINVQKDGIRKSFYCGTPGRTGQRECNRKADDWLDDNISGASLKVSELSERYMEQLKLTTSQSHWRQYQGYFDNWINKHIGTVKIDNLSEYYLQSVINKAYAKGLKKKTLQNIKACMLSFLKFCRSCKATTLMVEGLSIPKGAESKPKFILKPDDLKVLFSIDTTIDHRKRVPEQYINAYRFEVLTGLRPGEIVGLKWSDIQTATVSLQRSINAYQETTKGKNDNARRTFDLNELTNAVLIDQKCFLQEYHIISDYVFPNTMGNPVRQNTYYKHWIAYCEHNNLTKTSPYELRHTFVSISKSLPEGYLKQLVGHSKDMDTYGIYSHEVATDRAAAANMVQDIFSALIK